MSREPVAFTVAGERARAMAAWLSWIDKPAHIDDGSRILAKEVKYSQQKFVCKLAEVNNIARTLKKTQFIMCSHYIIRK